ncbi:MAG TPA: lipocalin family protein [Saprospiraceae bacterium]|nr:lipocalin family protein [Saprospiraceae bacterium]HPI08419.1 lipocalin family protein [Saprospiraceae bacterium]
MQKSLSLIVFLFFALQIQAQSPVGRWKLLSHTVDFGGEKMDTHAALLQQRPCAAKIVYEINADATFRLNAAASGCDQKYIDIQQKLYSKTQWKLEGNLITTSATNFAVGQSYKVSFSGDKMTWVGTEGQGTLVYQKL